jgi:hypothetical protein
MITCKVTNGYIYNRNFFWNYEWEMTRNRKWGEWEEGNLDKMGNRRRENEYPPFSS